MDIRGQISSGFVKVPDLADGPRRTVIEMIRDGRFGPEAEFRDGGKLSLNVTNMRTLANAWGTETDLWIGKEVELYVGQIRYEGALRDSVLTCPISPAIPMGERPKPKPKPPRDDFDDEIPF